MSLCSAESFLVGAERQYQWGTQQCVSQLPPDFQPEADYTSTNQLGRQSVCIEHHFADLFHSILPCHLFDLSHVMLDQSQDDCR